MNILILNWRDPLNPLAGGAEKLNMEILKSLVERGDKVVWFGKSVKGLPKKENYKGVEIIRFGNIFTHLLAWPWFVFTRKFGKIDLVIDCIHGVGYFTPVFMPKTKRKVLIYEVAQNIWNEMFPFPISFLGRLSERLMFFVYSRSKFWTISKSTEDDLIKMGIKKKNIEILPMGFDAPIGFKEYPKYKDPTALFVGRLVKMKGIEDAIEAISKTDWQLKVIGRGEPKYEKMLKELIKKLGVEDRVKFLGFTSEAEKFEEMAKAWVLLVPSSREGWGMIIPEANYVRTQVIGYNSPGVRDSLPYYSSQNILIDPSPKDLSQALIKIKEPMGIRMSFKPGWEILRKEILKSI